MAILRFIMACLWIGLCCGCSREAEEVVSDTAAQSAADGVTAADDPPGPSANCERWHEAFGTVSLQTQVAIQMLSSDAGFAQQQDPTLLEALRVDVVRLRAATEVLSTLPAPADPGPFRLPADAVAQLREIADLIERGLGRGQVFSDGSGDGEKLLQLLDDFGVWGRAAISSAIEKAGC